MANWEYQQTSVQVKNAREAATNHTNEMASAGWELLSAAPLFAFAVNTAQARGNTYGDPLPWGIETREPVSGSATGTLATRRQTR
jgi:hypothetical protein